jgi:hypothetical protein
LLYNAKAGFQFLVDSTEGWSLVKPATGVGVIKPDGSALYLGTRYTSQAQYSAQTDYVAGEFYWPVQRGYQTVNQDFASGNSLLNREQAGAEIVWSVGSRLSSEAVVQAFNIPAAQAALFKRDAAPHSLSRNTVLIGVIVLVLLASLVMLVSNNNQTKRCRAEYNLYSTLSQQQQLDQCKARNNYNNSLYNGSYGGSYGGYSSGGGGHK